MCKIRSIFLCFGLALSFVFMASEIALAKTVRSRHKKSSVVTVSKKHQVASVNINNDNAASIAKIKGIGKKTAKAIVDYRNKNGVFKSHEDLLKIKSRAINKKWLAKYKRFLKL